MWHDVFPYNALSSPVQAVIAVRDNHTETAHGPRTAFGNCQRTEESGRLTRIGDCVYAVTAGVERCRYVAVVETFSPALIAFGIRRGDQSGEYDSV